MSRVINTDGPGKLRNQLMRTAAEVIRRLSYKTQVDAETRDMVATLVYCFRQVEVGIDESVRAWEKRDYWLKAEQFRIKWVWVGKAASDLEHIIRTESWDELPPLLISLLPYFDDIKVSKFTRKPSLWQGAYQRLIQEKVSN